MKGSAFIVDFSPKILTKQSSVPIRPSRPCRGLSCTPILPIHRSGRNRWSAWAITRINATAIPVTTVVVIDRLLGLYFDPDRNLTSGSDTEGDARIRLQLPITAISSTGSGSDKIYRQVHCLPRSDIIWHCDP